MTSKSTGKKRRKKSWLSMVFWIVFTVVAIGTVGALGWFIFTKSSEQAEKIAKQAKIEAVKKKKEEARQKRISQLPPPPRELLNGSVSATVKFASAQGWKPCPGKCLKLATPGWEHKNLEGWPPTDIWFTFPYAGGSKYFSQRHIGHLIENGANGVAEDVGTCPICKGTGWVPKEP